MELCLDMKEVSVIIANIPFSVELYYSSNGVKIVNLQSNKSILVGLKINQLPILYECTNETS